MSKWFSILPNDNPRTKGNAMRIFTAVFAWLFFPALAAAQGSDWPKFLGPDGTSVSTEKGIIAPWPKDGLRIVWQTEVGPSYGMPVISKGKLYHFDRKPRNLGDEQDSKRVRLTCMDAQTGKEIWAVAYPSVYKDKFGYNTGPRCSPLVDGDFVYTHGVEGMLHCFKADTGEIVWRCDTVKEFNVIQNFFGVGSTPVIEGDLLIVQVGGSPAGSSPRDLFTQTLKPNGTGVVAFNKRTGKIAYKIGDELASYSSPVLATINNRRYCFVFARGGLLGFGPTTGRIDFHFPWRSDDVESVNASNPVVVGDKVFISETYGPGSALLKIKPGGVEPIWRDGPKLKKNMQCHWMTPIYHDGYLYGSSGRNTSNAELRCIDFETGKIQWTEDGLKRCSLLMIDGHFICLAEDGILRLLKVNPKKYDLVSEIELIDPKTKRAVLEYPCWAAPIVSHGLLYVRGEERLVCLELIPKK
jgi:outer membrane protein assembly factor BamB